MFDPISAPEIFARVPLARPGSGDLIVLSFPGLCIGFDGYAYIDPAKLAATVQDLKRRRVARLVVLPQEDELPEGAFVRLKASAASAGIGMTRLPVADFGVPDRKGNLQWRRCQPRLSSCLREGQAVAFCCLSGIGRSPTFAARMLCELGSDAAAAVADLRRIVQGAIETAEQARWVGQTELSRIRP